MRAATPPQSALARSAAAQRRPQRSPLRALPEQIADQLAQEIVEQVLKPGERLTELALCAQFGVSRAPVREALRLLEVRGLVRIEPRRGVRVTQLSAQEVDDLYEIRAALLGLVARRVAARRDAAFLETARALEQRLERFASHPAYGKYFEATYALANLIADAAGSDKLSSLVRSFSSQVARYTRLSHQTPERRHNSLRKWKRLLRAFEEREPDVAEATMRDMVFGTRDAVRAALGKKAAKLRVVG
jgi:DNA-binding GntR family transcriptional regulator